MPYDDDEVEELIDTLIETEGELKTARREIAGHEADAKHRKRESARRKAEAEAVDPVDKAVDDDYKATGRSLDEPFRI